jgi:hypothetical protein
MHVAGVAGRFVCLKDTTHVTDVGAAYVLALETAEAASAGGARAGVSLFWRLPV